MRIHITNWQIKSVTEGETIIGANPKGRLLSAQIEGTWLRLVTIEDEESYERVLREATERAAARKASEASAAASVLVSGSTTVEAAIQATEAAQNVPTTEFEVRFETPLASKMHVVEYLGRHLNMLRNEGHLVAGFSVGTSSSAE